MDAFIDREFQQLHPAPHSPRTRELFGRMVAISLALHVISSVILLSPHRNPMHIPPVSYLDLKNMQFQEEAAPSPPKVQQTDRNAETLSEARPPLNDSLPPTSIPLPETEKLKQNVLKSLADAEKNPASLQQSSLGLGLSNGYFSSIAEGESLRGDIREYYFSMLRGINEKWWLNKGGQQAGLRGALVTIVVARNGAIIQKMLVRSSGNPLFDKSIMQTLDAASPLSPLPQSFEMDYFSAPLRFRGPLNLFTS
ncbi:MAG TPA: TonB C-terminal domain-containing protein [Geobacteraceae bacterium]|nr:TonB C-terminal domain-containing protein [Geobacteraceae bacterium]